MIEAGLNVKMLQERLGHSTINITLDTYGHIYKQQGEEATMLAMEKWEASLANS
jgi:integrase